MKARSPLLGYNHNVRYAGRLYHVQTEDSGLQNPHVFTHLFFGGTILATKRYDYRPEDEDHAVQKMMQTQHKAMLKELRAGVFDPKIEKHFGEPVVHESKEIEPENSTRVTLPPSVGPEVTSADTVPSMPVLSPVVAAPLPVLIAMPPAKPPAPLPVPLVTAQPPIPPRAATPWEGVRSPVARPASTLAGVQVPSRPMVRPPAPPVPLASPVPAIHHPQPRPPSAFLGSRSAEGVVIARPAVIVNDLTPQRAPATPPRLPTAEPKSLDEVILAYLAEELPGR